MKIIFHKIVHLFLRALFYLWSFIATVALYLCIGYTSSLALILLSVIGFAFTSIFRNQVWRRFVVHKKLQTKKTILSEFIIFSLLCQFFLLAVFPVSSLLPKSILESIKITHYVEGEECNIEAYINEAKNFWGDQIDFTKVNVVEGGIMKNLHYLQKIGWIAKDNNYVRDANVFGSTIYVADASACLSKPTIFHELTHVWQVQNTVIFGPELIPDFIHITYQQFYDPHTPYDYGGYYGLKKAKEEGKAFLDFGMEQQAMIVQHLRWFNDGLVFTEEEGGKVYTEAYKSILEEYVNEMLSFKRS